MSKSDFNILDTNWGDRVINNTSLAAMITNGTSPGQIALALAIQTILDTTPSPVVASQLVVDTGTKTAAATAGAATLNKNSGKITSESITTAAGSEYTLTLTDSQIAAADIVLASVQLGTSTQGEPQVTTVTVSATQVIIVIKNIHATLAFNGTIVVSFVVFKNAAS